jgi:hypothetical protein
MALHVMLASWRRFIIRRLKMVPSLTMGTLALLHAPTTPSRLLEGAAKSLVAVTLAAGAWKYAADFTDAQNEAVARFNKAGTVAKFDPANLQKAIEEMKETSTTLGGWSLLVLGGTVGIAILAKGARIRDRHWALTLIPTAWLLLWESMSNGAEFRRALTFQVAKGAYSFPDLNAYLYMQLHFFLWSLAVLGGLAAIYLFFRFSLLEEPAKGDSD